MNNWLIITTFTEVSSHHLWLVPNILITQNKLCVHKAAFLTSSYPAPGNHQSVTILDTLY